MAYSFLFMAAIVGYRLGKRCAVVRRAFTAIFVTHLEIRLCSARLVRLNEKNDNPSKRHERLKSRGGL